MSVTELDVPLLRDLPLRVAQLRDAILTHGVATEAELARYAPGGAENPSTGTEGLLYQWWNLGRIFARVERRIEQGDRVFDADAYRAAHATWALRIDGKEYPARPLSAPGFVEYRRRIESAGNDPARQLAAFRWLLRQLFPRRMLYVWAPRLDPVELLLAAPRNVRDAALADFFERSAGTPPAEMTGSSTSSSRSSSSSGFIPT